MVRTSSISQYRDAPLIGEIRKLNRNDLIIFLIPVVVFSIYLMVFNPAIATLDSFNQLHQIASGQFTNWHPFFHTFIEMLCLKIYPSTISICILQILVFSIMWTSVCKYFRDDDVHPNRTFRWQAIISLIICIIPINGLYAVTLWKDILFSYFLMFSCFLIKVMLDRGGDVGCRFIVLLSVVMAFVAQLRGNGMYVALICLAVYFIYLFAKKNVRMAVLLVIVAVAMILMISSLDVAYDVEDNAKDAFMTKLAHMLADYDLNLDMEASDRDKVHELIDKDRVKDRYMRTGTDSTLAITNIKNYENDKFAFIEIALKYSLRNPLHFIQYLFASSPMVWDIINDSWAGRPYYMNGEEDRLQMDFNYYYGRHNYTPHEPYENLSYANWGTPAFDALNLLSMGIEASIFDTVFNSPALYMYISIAILIWIHLATGNREIYLMYIPNLLNIVIVFFSTPIQDYRYLYANLLVCYMLIIIFIGLKLHSGYKSEISSE